MILVLHILIATFSVLYATYVFFTPTDTKLKISYGLVALTIISGTYLVVTKPAHILQTCVTGLVYIGIVSVLIVAARTRLPHRIPIER